MNVSGDKIHAWSDQPQANGMHPSQPPATASYAPHATSAYTGGHNVPQGYAPAQGYVPPPGHTGYPPPGYAMPAYAPYGGMPPPGYPSAAVAPSPGALYGMPYPYAVPVGQVPPELVSRIGFAAFAAGMPASVYSGIAQMMGIPQQPQTNDPRNRITTGKWDVGLFSGCDHLIPNGLMACVCPCISLAQILIRLGSPRYGAVLMQFVCMWTVPVVARLMPEIMIRSMGGSDFDLPVIVNLPVLFPLIMTAFILGTTRSRIRTRFQIPGAPCEDCAVACCCSPCAIAQIATHVKSYTPGDCSFGPPEMLPPFQY